MASKLTATDIANIGNQGAVRSSPLRSNFTALKNKINEVIDALAAAAIGTTNAETTAARPYHASLLDRLDSAWKGQYNFVKSGGVVTLNSNPQKVDVSAGEAKVDGADVKWNSATSGTIAYTVSNTRYDVVVANSDSTISIVIGAASATPVLPILAASQKALAILLVSTSAVTIFSDTTARDDNDYFDGSHDGSIKYLSVQKTIKRQIFTSNGTWYRPYGVSTVKILVVGAGGAGGSSASGRGAGGGGGAGAVRETIISVSGNVTVTVGATGNSSFGSFTANAGEDGESTISAQGGNGGDGGGYGSPGGGGGGGHGTFPGAGGNGGYFGQNGSNGVAASDGGGGTGGSCVNDGGFGMFAPGLGVDGGGGGAAGWGGDGGEGGASGGTDNGGDAQGYGAGGGGAGGNGAGLGGAGGPGICIVEWEE